MFKEAAAAVAVAIAISCAAVIPMGMTTVFSNPSGDDHKIYRFSFEHLNLELALATISASQHLSFSDDENCKKFQHIRLSGQIGTLNEVNNTEPFRRIANYLEVMDLNAPDPRKLELQELQKQHKHMELDRRAYTEDSQSHLKKQQVLIDKLRKDNNSIKSDISEIVRSSCRPISFSEQDTIHKMQDQGEKYTNAIERELKNIELIEDQISLMKHKCQNQRRTMGGVNASKNNIFMIQKQIGILENRLDKSFIKYNEAIAHNKVLSDDIDNLRRERAVFENIYRKIERELQDRKQKMIEIIEISNQSYEQRDSYQQETAAIERANRREQEEFEERMMELGRLLESGR